jgi:hypothetical protein
MIHFERPGEPPDFHTTVRQPGNDWLRRNPTSRPKDYWSSCLPHLAAGFRYLCGYSAMYVPPKDGTVDHFLSKTRYRHKSYCWNNYRYASWKINNWKSDRDLEILDPFEVQDGWFEIQLTSLQLVMTDCVPSDRRNQANNTLEYLRIGTDEKLIIERRSYYKALLDGECNLRHLENRAPLIREAVLKIVRDIRPIPEDLQCHRMFIQGDMDLGELRRDAPALGRTIDDILPPCGDVPTY